MKSPKVTKFIARPNETKLLGQLKKLTGWNASQIIREALKQFAAAKGVQ
jgi:hypothetical protein